MKKLFKNLFVAVLAASALFSCESTEDDGIDLPTLSIIYSQLIWDTDLEPKTVQVNITDADSVKFDAPDGWSVTYNEEAHQITVTPASVASNTAIFTGTITAIAYGAGVEATKDVAVVVYNNTDFDFETTTFEDDGDSYWADKIASEQYYGGCELLYGTYDELYYNSDWDYYGDYILSTPYTWNCPTTELSHSMSLNYSNGGLAVSNYVETDITKGTSSTQLSVPTNGGNNDSDNFCVVYYSAWAYPNNAVLSFEGSDEKTIASMYVAPTTYLLNSLKNGDNYATAMTSNTDYFKIVATAYDATGAATGASSTFALVENGVIKEDWSKWEMSSLGAAHSIEFSFLSSDVDGWGNINTPTYFAFDDVVVAVAK